jgi:hypothetical protein
MSNADLADDPGGHRLESRTPGGRNLAGVETPLLVAVGIGGRLELTAEQIRLVKGGVFGHAVELLWLGYGVTEKSIPVREISAVEIVKPLFLPDFIRFSYPGSPRQTGSYIEDVLAENALLMSWFDNRVFYQIKTWIDRWPHLAPQPVVADGRGAA